MKQEVYPMVNEFLRKYPLTMAFRLRKHCKVMEKHLNPGEEIIYAFPAQKNDISTTMFSTCVVALTNKRILIAQKRVLPGYVLNSITPDLFNDFQVYKKLIWGKIELDTVKELVKLGYIDPRALVEVETNLSEYLIKIKPNFKNENQNQ